jgi:hypothetical protein
MKSKTKSKFIKVVINTCHGGFNLSPKAIEKIAERKGKKCFFFKNTVKDGKMKDVKIKGYPTGIYWIIRSITYLPDQKTEQTQTWLP